MVDMGGYELRVRTAGESVPGRPTVVFESGLGTPLENWVVVQGDLAREIATFAYDRAGIGHSDAGREAPTLSHIVDELHALLAKTGTSPPYLLVGHSMGGPVIRTFASRYPDEVAGLVYVDPTNFEETVADQEALWRELGVPDGRQAYFRMMASYYQDERMPAAVRAEAAAFDSEWESGFPTIRGLPASPDVPLVVLLAGSQDLSMPPELEFPGGDEAAHFEADLRQRARHMLRLSREVEEGTVLITPNSTHYIQYTEPDLVAWAIRRVLYPDLRRRLTAASLSGADSVVRLYHAARRTYPQTAFSEFLLNAVGYALLQQGNVDDAVAIFELNVAEYPDASNPYDSLGEAYMARGDRELAIRNYEKSLALDPYNANAVARLAKLRGQ